MHILSHLPSPSKNAPPPLLDIPGYAPASCTQFLHNIIIINLVVPGHYQHKHCHYCSNNHYSIPSVTYVYLYILDVE